MISETLLFLNIGTSEMILILVVALFFFGGKKLPELARGLGRGIREFKDASETIKRDISDQINNFEKDLEIKDEPKAIAQHATDNEASTYGDSGQDNPEDVSPDQYYQNHDYDYNYPEETVDHPIADPIESAAYNPGPEETDGLDHPAASPSENLSETDSSAESDAGKNA